MTALEEQCLIRKKLRLKRRPRELVLHDSHVEEYLFIEYELEVVWNEPQKYIRNHYGR